jgi:hypothetical protein
MSIKTRDKDNLKDHAGVALVPMESFKSDDPLQFWTNHPTENELVDLRCFADGEFKRPISGGKWAGPFTGRDALIRELMPAVEATYALSGIGKVDALKRALRTWWRLFDAMEATLTPSGRPLAKVTCLADIGAHHETAAHQQGVERKNFHVFIALVDATRKMQGKPTLGWMPPGKKNPIRHLIPEDQARDIRTALKQDWERVRKTWARNDRLRAEAERRETGEPPIDLSAEDEDLLANWHHYRRIQWQTGLILPSGEQLMGHWKIDALKLRGLDRTLMRSIHFPTVEEADTAFHLALMNAGWNPSTLARVDATSPLLINTHPKDEGQLVLSTEALEDDDEAELQADKPRAGGTTQFCTGKKTQPSCAPMIVDAYLKRVGPLRELLQQECQSAEAELARLRTTGAEQKRIAQQVKRVQTLEFGRRSVWLYVTREGAVNWIAAGQTWDRYPTPDGKNLSNGNRERETYLDQGRRRLNAQRAAQGRPAIPKVTPSDFRDIYARAVYVRTNGNILAVMLALGHKRISSTFNYTDNNIFSAENDATARRFLTHFFVELERGRIDLTILAQLARHGPLTPEMEARLMELRKLMRSRVGAACSNPRNPPIDIVPNHVAGRLCGAGRCLNGCQNANFLPESLDGIAMRLEELLVLSDYLPRETWLRGKYDEELANGEALLDELFSPEPVAQARARWRARIKSGEHLIPGLGRLTRLEEAA